VQISGKATGTTIEGVSVRGTKTAGFKLANAAGEPGRPILLSRCRATVATSVQTGVWLNASNADTLSAHVQGLRVDGTTGAGVGVRIEGACADVEIAESRFYNLDAAVWFGKPPTGKLVGGRVVANTVYQSAAGLNFYHTPPGPPTREPPPGKFELTVERNYFANTLALAVAGAPRPTGVKSNDNAIGPESAQGLFPIIATPLPKPTLFDPDPADDASFLRFPGGPPDLPPKNVKVGAP
jgi:hypothetical protein